MDDTTRASWNVATRNHNAHKGDQAARLRAGEQVLFPEELGLLGDLTGKSVVHLQCNAGQDTLCLARTAGSVLGVDFSDEAITFARQLSTDACIPARFQCAEVVGWLATTDERFDVAFSSYGAAGWLPDLTAWARGLERVLVPGGRFVYVEFHPLVWAIDQDLRLAGDDYFNKGPYVAPVGDYVATSGAGLGAAEGAIPGENTTPATAWQHTLADVVDALAGAGLHVERLREYPYSNGCRVCPALVPGEGRRWEWPPGTARLPLMFGLVASKAHSTGT